MRTVNDGRNALFDRLRLVVLLLALPIVCWETAELRCRLSNGLPPRGTFFHYGFSADIAMSLLTGRHISTSTTTSTSMSSEMSNTVGYIRFEDILVNRVYDTKPILLSEADEAAAMSASVLNAHEQSLIGSTSSVIEDDSDVVTPLENFIDISPERCQPDTTRSLWGESQDSSIKGDWHVFIIWNGAYLGRNEIIRLIKVHFHIVRAYEFTFDETNFDVNIWRLLGGFNMNNAKSAVLSKRLEAIGYGSFTVLVVRDPEPRYRRVIRRNDKLACTNINMYEHVTSALRLSSGGTSGFQVLGTYTPLEADFLLMLLLHMDCKRFVMSLSWDEKHGTPWDSYISPRSDNTLGLHVWASEFSFCLNLRVSLRYSLYAHPNLRKPVPCRMLTFKRMRKKSILSKQFGNVDFIMVAEEKNAALAAISGTSVTSDHKNMAEELVKDRYSISIDDHTYVISVLTPEQFVDFRFAIETNEGSKGGADVIVADSAQKDSNYED